MQTIRLTPGTTSRNEEDFANFRRMVPRKGEVIKLDVAVPLIVVVLCAIAMIWVFRALFDKVTTPKPRNPLAGREVQCTCEACGKLWHYGQKEIDATIRSVKLKKAQAVAALAYPVALAAQMPGGYQWFAQCPECGSQRIKKQLVDIETGIPVEEGRPSIL